MMTIVTLTFAFLPQHASGQTEVVHITMIGNEFKPSPVEVPAGEVVQFDHQDGTELHTVTSDDPALEAVFDSSPTCARGVPAQKCMTGGDSYRFVFLQPGTYGYHCRIHGAAPSAALPEGSGMRGTIVVK
jgi:plastocyanin